MISPLNSPTNIETIPICKITTPYMVMVICTVSCKSVPNENINAFFLKRVNIPKNESKLPAGILSNISENAGACLFSNPRILLIQNSWLSSIVQQTKQEIRTIEKKPVEMSFVRSIVSS